MAIPSTTFLQVISQGSAPPSCMAQLASRERAASALLAWIVVSDPLDLSPVPITVHFESEDSGKRNQEDSR